MSDDIITVYVGASQIEVEPCDSVVGLTLRTGSRVEANLHLSLDTALELAAALERCADARARLVDVARRIERICESEADWETKFDLIFGTHREKVRPLLDELNLSLDYYDPDTTYEEDAQAYVSALSQLRKNLEKCR